MATDVFAVVLEAMEKECALTPEEEVAALRSMLHLSRSLASFRPYLISPEDETHDTPVKGIDGSCARKSTQNVTLKIEIEDVSD